MNGVSFSPSQYNKRPDNFKCHIIIDFLQTFYLFITPFGHTIFMYTYSYDYNLAVSQDSKRVKILAIALITGVMFYLFVVALGTFANEQPASGETSVVSPVPPELMLNSQ